MINDPSSLILRRHQSHHFNLSSVSLVSELTCSLPPCSFRLCYRGRRMAADGWAVLRRFDNETWAGRLLAARQVARQPGSRVLRDTLLQPITRSSVVANVSMESLLQRFSHVLSFPSSPPDWDLRIPASCQCLEEVKRGKATTLMGGTRELRRRVAPEGPGCAGQG